MATQLIGARIKALREERKLSQDDLARVFGFKEGHCHTQPGQPQRQHQPDRASSDNRHLRLLHRVPLPPDPALP